MSAYAISQLPVPIDSTLLPDMGVTRGRPSTVPTIAGGATPTRPADFAPKAELIDLEPQWLAAADAATD